MAKKIVGIVKKVKRPKTTPSSKQPKNTGVSLEKIVARIQQMMDPHSTVAWNEWLTDRVGNRRQYDVVIKGEFGGRPILGIIECKDHNRRRGRRQQFPVSWSESPTRISQSGWRWEQ